MIFTQCVGNMRHNWESQGMPGRGNEINKALRGSYVLCKWVINLLMTLKYLGIMIWPYRVDVTFEHACPLKTHISLRGPESLVGA